MYLVDANILIEAKNRYYAFDIAPGFWTWLEQGHQAGELISIDAVRDELLSGDDELADWARDHPGFFLPVDQRTAQNFAPLSMWAARQDYRQDALNVFSSDQADFLLIAHAAGHGDTVVTNELPSPNARKRVKVPDACAAMGVEYVDIFTVLRTTGAKLHLHGADGSTPAPAPLAPTIPGLD